MNNIVLNPKDNSVLILDKSDCDYTINILENTNVKILEYDILNSQITINLARYSSLKYNTINLKKSDVKRNFNLENNTNLNVNTVNLNELNDITIVDLVGDYAVCNINNLAIIKDSNQNFDTKINHNAHNGTSKIYNLGVALDNSNICFDCKGYVSKKMEINDCRQLSKGIIVGKNAKITEKPILLIDNYNVSAYHGASIGRMSDEQLFYLMSRGISKKDAYKLILSGLIAPFIKEIADDKKNDDVTNAISDLLKEEE